MFVGAWGEGEQRDGRRDDDLREFTRELFHASYARRGGGLAGILTGECGQGFPRLTGFLNDLADAPDEWVTEVRRVGVKPPREDGDPVPVLGVVRGAHGLGHLWDCRADVVCRFGWVYCAAFVEIRHDVAPE